jgi:hypothetical protein
MKQPGRGDVLEALGALVADARRRGLRERDVEARAEQRWRARREATTGAWGRWIAGLAGTAVLACAAWVVVSSLRAPGALVAHVEERVLEVGRWVEAREDLSVDFSDGTAVEVRTGGRARIEHADARGARVVLERGALRASVVHQHDSSWLFRVGPYDVEVTGTRFEASWEPRAERFELVMTEGSVQVSGPALADRREMVAGERLVLGPDALAPDALGPDALGPDEAMRDEPAPIAAGDPAPEEPRSTARASERGSRDPRTGASELATRAHRDPPAEAPTGQVSAAEGATWAQLAGEARYDDALEAAEARGFEHLCATLPLEDVLRLGDVARYARVPARSEMAYQAVRARAPGTDRAAMAAYSLALARWPSAEATVWLEAYLAEAPRGALAREARGRLVEAHRRAGRDAEARAAAEAYLAHHPDGPHAELARSLLP